MHGDLGMVSKDDVVIAISFSGESDEIVKILPTIKLIGAKLIGITGNGESTLAEASDIVQVLPDFEEACYLGLAPTSSTTVALCYGDALAVVASGVYGFKDRATLVKSLRRHSQALVHLHFSCIRQRQCTVILEWYQRMMW